MKPILIVEDETIMREALRDWLTNSGYQVETAKDGEEALKTVLLKEFPVAIFDLKLPGKNGIEVLREVKQKSPQLKAIIITAYPTIETVVEAMKVGATDYLTKPLNLNELEKRLVEILGPVQAEIRPKTVKEEPKAKPAVEEKPRVEAPVIILHQDILVHLKQGMDLFNAAKYQEAFKKFVSILAVAPGDIETRIWLARARKALTSPGTEKTAEAEKLNYCVWMSRGLVDYRLCTFDYDCVGCEYEQRIQNRIAAGDPMVLEVFRKELNLPGDQRVCRYTQKREVSYRLCPRLFQCVSCEFSQQIDDVSEQKLTARQAAIDKRKQSWWWSYWG